MPATQQPKPGSTPFVTRVVETLADGHRHIHLSRRHRKRLPPLHLTEGGAATAVLTRHSPWLRFWAPRGLAWWIAVLFMLGSTCFAVGSLGANWPQALPTWLAGGGAIGLVFFVGSLFFTSAAWLQWLEATNGDVADIAAAEPPHRGATWRWCPAMLGGWPA